MSDNKTASDLLCAFVEAEKDIELAEQAMNKARLNLVCLRKEIKERPALSAVLRSAGVICNGRLTVLKGDSLVIYPAPEFSHNIKEEDEGNE